MASTKVPIELSSTPGIVDNSNATAITIDSSENVGIGTTSPEHALHVNGGTANTVAQFQSTDANAYIEFLDSDAGASGCFIGGAGDDFVVLPNAIEKFRVTSSGNVGIGTTSPAEKLHIAASSYTEPTGGLDDNINLLINNSQYCGIQILGSSTGSSFIHFGDQNNADVGLITYQHNGDYMRFDVNASERMRIDSDGRLLINCTSAPSDSVAGIDLSNTNGIRSAKSTTSFAYHARFYNPNGQVGYISTSGSATVYSASSDYRLKENIQPLANGLERVQQLKPVQFDWKESGETSEGFIAHEVQEIFSDAVSGEKDGVDMQGMDYGRITPLLVKAIQEQQVLIEQLQAEVALLKGE